MVPAEVRDYYAQQVARASAAAAEWDSTFAQYAAQHPDLAAQFTRRMRGELPADEHWVDKLPANPAVSPCCGGALVCPAVVLAVFGSIVDSLLVFHWKVLMYMCSPHVVLASL